VMLCSGNSVSLHFLLAGATLCRGNALPGRRFAGATLCRGDTLPVATLCQGDTLPGRRFVGATLCRGTLCWGDALPGRHFAGVQGFRILNPPAPPPPFLKT